MYQFQLSELSLGPGPYGVRRPASDEEKKELMASLLKYPFGVSSWW